MTRATSSFLAVLALGLIALNVFTANRDSSGMKCYAQPVSAECPA